MQNSFSRWSTLVMFVAVGVTSFTGCKSTRLSQMPGMGWLAKKKAPATYDPNGVPVPPASIALPAGAQVPGGVAVTNGTGAVPPYAAPNYATPNNYTAAAYTAATGPRATRPAAPNSTARPTNGYPLNGYGAGASTNPAASQPWGATTQPPTQPPTGTAAPQRGLYATDGYGAAGAPPNYGPRKEADRSMYSPRSESGSDAGYPRTADSRSRYGAAPTTAARTENDRWGGSTAPREESSMYRDSGRDAYTGSAAVGSYDRSTAPPAGERASRFGGDTTVAPATTSDNSYRPTTQPPYSTTDARADYLSPGAAPATTRPAERDTTTGTNRPVQWNPGSTSRYEGAAEGSSTGSVRSVAPGPVAPASYRDETATVPTEPPQYYGGETRTY